MAITYPVYIVLSKLECQIINENANVPHFNNLSEDKTWFTVNRVYQDDILEEFAGDKVTYEEFLKYKYIKHHCLEIEKYLAIFGTDDGPIDKLSLDDKDKLLKERGLLWP